ncbi:MAG: DUF3108 domain-containing protein [Comamonadaceae bacterium]|nr:DUF3108 domain-containing protein [Comamonadaceae bacterium]
MPQRAGIQSVEVGLAHRHLLRTVLLVLALHLLALWGWPQLPTTTATPAQAAMQTRSIAAPAPPPPAPAPAPRAPPKPKPKPQPKPRPAPAPEPIPEPVPESIPEPEPVPPPEPAPEPAPAPEPTAESAPATATETTAETATAPPAPELPPAPPAEPQDPGLQITAADGQARSLGRDNAPAVRVPPPTRLAFEVHGEVKRFRYSASAELLWQHDGQQYQAKQEIRAFLIGSRAQTSVGQLGAWGLQPQRFGDRVRSEQAAHFDFDAGRVTFSANTPAAPIVPGAQDRLSVFIELASLIAAAPENYPSGTQLALTTASARAVDRWVFRVVGPELLQLPAGSIEALKLERVPQAEYDQQADLWLAPSVHYLPVRLRITQSNGDFVELQLKDSSPP